MVRRLIIGLGNPGAEYANTRHNVGFMVVDALARQASARFRPPKAGSTWTSRFRSSPRTYDVAECTFKGRKFCLIKPQTFMNNSGEAVRKAMNRYSAGPDDTLVIYDDINLPLGAVRLRDRGGAGGHNGLQDILQVLNSDNLPRMRVGIGNNFTRGAQVEYVLSPFGDSEREAVEETIAFAGDAALSFVRDGIHVAMNRFNRKRSRVNETE